MTLTKDMTELWEQWAKIYINIRILKCTYPPTRKKLEELQEKAAEFHQVFSEFPGVNT